MIRRIKTGHTAKATEEQQAHVRATVEDILADCSQRFDKWSPKSFRLSKAEIESCVTDPVLERATL